MIERNLVNPETGQVWSGCQEGTRAITSAGKGKPREKAFATEEDARNYVRNEVWSRLKKGYVFRRPAAASGEPVMHRYIGKGYTGFMPLAPVSGTNRFYAGYVVGQFEREDILLFDEQGDVKRTDTLGPGSLVYDMVYCGETGMLLMNESHRVVGLPAAGGTMKRYTEAAEQPVSALALSKATVVWYDGSALVVTDLRSGRTLAKRQAECRLYGGHTPQLSAALSGSGALVAYCSDMEEIVVWSWQDGREQRVRRESGSMVKSMFFAPDDQSLYVQEQYGDDRLHGVDLRTQTTRSDWAPVAVSSYAVNEDKGLLAVYHQGSVLLCDLQTGRAIHSFGIEYVVKRCSLAFTEDFLAVYTDYGCVSLYAHEASGAS